MTFKERLFICKRQHVTRSWQWNNVEHIPCGTLNCRANAWRAITGRGRNAQNAQPFVYYQNKAGEIFVAATSDDTRAPRGYTRKEIRTMHEYSSFRREHGERNRREAEVTRELDRQQRAEANEVGREALRSMMPHLSAYGQDIAKQAIEASYADNVDRVETDCYLQGFEMDRSERPEYADERSGYRRMD